MLNNQYVKDYFAGTLKTMVDMFLDSQAIEFTRIAGNAMGLALHEGKKILVFGNGGSATDSAHFCAELVGYFPDKVSDALPAIDLTAFSASITAITNDANELCVFPRMIDAFGKKGDIALGISTSGSSPNITQSLDWAREKGLMTVFLTSTRMDWPRDYDHIIKVPSGVTSHIQEMHIMVLHVWAKMIDQRIKEWREDRSEQ
jgi:D-sedoheptulose 7-phosphate isomerase